LGWLRALMAILATNFWLLGRRHYVRAPTNCLLYLVGESMSTPLSTEQKRFSKAKMIAHLERLLADIQATHNFDPTNGWAQVRGHGEEKNREYGRYAMLRGLLVDLRGGFI
jgi:hypothetical protein